MKFNSALAKLVKLTSKYSKGFYVYSLLRSIVLATKAFVGVYGLSLIIQGLASGSYDEAFMYICFVIVAEMIIKFFEVILLAKVNYGRSDILYKTKGNITRKAMDIEFENLENPDFLQTVNKSIFAIDNFGSLNRFLDGIIEMVGNFIILVSLITIIVLFNPIILAIIGFTILVQLLFNKKSIQMQNEIVKELGPLNRRLAYFTQVVQDPRYQKDFRLYKNTGDLIYGKMNEFLAKTNGFLVKFQTTNGKYQMYRVIVNYFQITAIYLLVGYMSVTQNLGIASYVLLTASAIRVATAINEFARSIFTIRESIQRLKPTLEILGKEDSQTIYQSGDICEPFKSLRFDNVRFTYPGTEKEILKGVSFEINKDEKVSIVGLNGAGKTTIVKLISRLYEPTEGTIYWNNKPINSYDYHSYIDEMSAVFQDFKLFALTISENVDLMQANKEEIKSCLYAVGLEDKIKSLPNEEDSYLSKEYSEEGIDLSGGEKQKIAIARAMYKDSSLAILDEPTSALDPLSEAEIYENFSDLTKDKTTIYISHRMSSSTFCDKIIVIDEGKVSHIDTHHNLMKNKESLYYQLFNSQSNYYMESVGNNKLNALS
ncbi:ABC transporter ATP-binding protein [Candidatus Izemoplasma sp. B36]|uniref:ABC transporter ATP-binding protein n=1 Tax=Candidatus Izemoplasma sp. B36 TaxID=3242468 RepID=UPI003555EE36